MSDLRAQLRCGDDRRSHRMPGGSYSQADRFRLADALDEVGVVSEMSVAELLEMSSRVDRSRAPDLARCVFDHVAVMLFPSTLAAGIAELDEWGLEPSPVVPSTVVRRRIARRFGLPTDECDVQITRLVIDLPDGRRRPALEVFLLARDSSEHVARIEKCETANEFERHTAIELRDPDPGRVIAVADAWRSGAGLVREESGFNPMEAGGRGSTVHYFVRDPDRGARRRRFELYCRGDLRDITEDGPDDAAIVARAYANWAAGPTTCGASSAFLSSIES